MNFTILKGESKLTNERKDLKKLSMNKSVELYWSFIEGFNL